MVLPREGYSTCQREEVQQLSNELPKRWHVEEFFKFNQAIGWYFGAEGFRQELLEAMSIRIGPERRENQESNAESLIATELRKRRLSQDRLASLTEGDSPNLEIASRLQSETTMSVAWTSQGLKMGHATTPM